MLVPARQTLLDRLGTALQGRYRIERELGRGGMATVYLAHDLKYDRPVALKVLHSDLAASLGPERFQREIRFAARLQHPHILTVLDSGEAAGQLWYTMPYVEGESLRDRLDREHQLSIEEAVRIGRETALALDYAHQHGVIHRDIKPENLLLTRDGSTLVADFGVARALAGGESELTGTGIAIGTPAYMSPEQASGARDVDSRTDIYSLGAVLYEMLAGETPFRAPTTVALIAQRFTDTPRPLRTLRDNVPEALEQVVSKALARDPADRFNTAAELAHALAQPVGRDLAAPTHRRGNWSRWIAAAVLAVLILSGAALMTRRSGDRANVAPSAASIAVLPFTPASRDTALARLGRDLVVTLSANLDGVDDIRTVDALTVLAQAPPGDAPLSLGEAIALARKLGARGALYGSLIRTGPNVRLDVGLFPSDSSTPLARASVVASLADVAAITDSVTWALLRQVWRTRTPPTPTISAITTRSVPALRDFLEGERAVVSYRWRDAARAFGRAIEADSTFWLAYWRYAWAKDWIAEPVDSVIRRGYLDHRAALPEREQLLIEESPLPLSDRLARHREATERFPDYWPGWIRYADLHTHQSPLVGHTAQDAQAALERTAALNPNLLAAWQHLAWVTLIGDSAAAEQAIGELTRRGYAATSLDELGWDELQTFRLINHSSRPRADSIALIDSIARHLSSGRIPRGLRWYPPLFLAWGGAPGAQIETSRRVLRLGVSRELAPLYQSGIVASWAARGAWDSALAALDRNVPADDTTAVVRYRLAGIAAWIRAVDPAVALQSRPSVARVLPGLTAEERAEVAWIDGLVAATRNDRTALATARRAVRESGDSAAPLVDSSLAEFEREMAGDRRAAASRLAALEWRRAERGEGFEHHPYLIAVNRLAAARWLGREGDANESARLLTWPDAMCCNPDPGNFEAAVMFGSLTYFERGRLEEMQGRSETARRYYEQFLRRYDQPVASHLHLVQQAQAALLRLR